MQGVFKTDEFEHGPNGELYRIKKAMYDYDEDLWSIDYLENIFRREYQVTSSLQGLDGVVQIVGNIDRDEEGLPFFRMHEIPGKNFDEVLNLARTRNERGYLVRSPMSHLSRFVLKYFVELAYVLHGVHEKGVVHKDLKPGNVMVTPYFTPVIFDFGMADIADFIEEGRTCGTPAFMSPEVGKGYSNADRRSDIYSLGCFLYECLTGHRVFSGNDRRTMIKHIKKKPTSAIERNPNILNELDELIMDCLEKDPRDRLQTAKEFGDRLKEIAREKLYMSI